MTPDPKIDCAGAPVIGLAGQEWFVPLLAMRQNRLVIPGLMKLMPALATMQAGGAEAMAALNEETFDLIVVVVHGALTRAYPTLSRDAFLDLPATTPELIAALTIITRQTGFFKQSAPGETQGETPTPATAPPVSSTVSSPIIANAPESAGATS